MRKILKNRSGETIVEVIVSFVIVLMGIAAFTTAAAGALKLYDRARALEMSNRTADQTFYAARGSAAGGTSTLTFTRGGVQEFTCDVGQAGVGFPGGGTRYYFYPAD